MSTCGSCGAEIFWARTVNGKSIPLEYATAATPKGNIYVEEDVARVVPSGTGAFISHFVTCPASRVYRSKR
jgi:hypothetical protein